MLIRTRTCSERADLAACGENTRGGTIEPVVAYWYFQGIRERVSRFHRMWTRANKISRFMAVYSGSPLFVRFAGFEERLREGLLSGRDWDLICDSIKNETLRGSCETLDDFGATLCESCESGSFLSSFFSKRSFRFWDWIYGGKRNECNGDSK